MVLGSLAPFAMTQTQVSIPKAQGTTHPGASVLLPDALKGRPGVLVVGFNSASQGPVSSWGRRLAADYGPSAGATYFEVAMLAGAPGILRGMIEKKIGASLPEAERAHFLPLTENEAGWRAAAHYAKPDEAYLLLVDGAGVVRWQTQGDATDAAYAELKKKLEELTAQGSAR